MARDRTSGGRPPAAEPPAQQQPRQNPPPPPSNGGNKPVFEARLGRVKAAVWANSGESGVWFSVVFSRLYKDGDTWKRSESFGRDDLPLVQKLADRVHSWIYEQQSAADQPA